MATAVGKFYGEFGLDIDPFIKSIREVQREAKSVENSLKPLTNAAKEMGEAFAVTGAVISAVMLESAQVTAEYGAELEHLHIRSGVTTEDASKLAFAAEQSGSSMEGLATGLRFLSRNLELASNGSKVQMQAFNNLGITQKELLATHRNTGEAFALLAEKINGMADPTQHAADLVAVLGRGYTELLPTLSLGTEGLKTFGDAAERLGVVVSGEAAEADLKYEQTTKQLITALKGISVAIGDEIIPSLTAYATKLVDGLVQLREFISRNKELIDVFGAVGVGLTGAGGIILGLAAALTILPKVTDAVKLLSTAIEAFPLIALGGAFAAAAVAAVHFEHVLYGGMVGVARLVLLYFQALAEGAGTLATAMGATGLGKTFTDASTYLQGITDNMLDMRNVILDNSEAVDNITPLIEKFGKAHQKASEGVFQNAEAMKEAQKIEDELGTAAAKDFIDRHKEMVRQSDEAMDEFWKQREKDRDDDIALQVAAAADFIREHKREVAESDKAMDEFWKQREKDRDDDIALQVAAADDFIREHKRAVAESEKAMDEFWKKREDDKQRLQNTISDVKKSAGAIFDDMFLKGENVFKSLQNMLKGGVLSIGRTIFEDIVGALTGPVLNAFRNFFNTTLKGIIDGALGGIGKSIGAAIGGLIGIGVPHLPGGAAGPVLTSGGAGISGAALAAFATNPITIGVAAAAAAALAIKHFVGQGRKTANEFGEEVQSPFGAALSAINNPFDTMKAAGTLTLDAAKKAKDALTNLWSNFTSTANQFATEGKNQAKVVSQAFTTMTTNFGPGLSNLFGKIDAAISELSIGAGKSAASVPDTGRALSASSMFADAVQVFKSVMDKIGAGGGGVGGSQPITVSVVSAPVFNVSVDSGELALQVRDVILPEALKDLQGDVNTMATKLIQILKPRWDSTPNIGGAAV